MPAIKQSDNNYTADIIDNSQRRQENSHTQRNPLPQKSQNGKGKSDIGSHWDGSPACFRSCITHQKEEKDRHDHTTASGNYRKDRLTDRTEFADQNLLLDLQPYHKEEYGHQGIIHKSQHRHRLSVMREQIEFTDLKIYGIR